MIYHYTTDTVWAIKHGDGFCLAVNYYKYPLQSKKKRGAGVTKSRLREYQQNDIAFFNTREGAMRKATMFRNHVETLIRGNRSIPYYQPDSSTRIQNIKRHERQQKKRKVYKAQTTAGRVECLADGIDRNNHAACEQQHNSQIADRPT